MIARFLGGPIIGYLLAGLLAAVPAWFAAHNIGYASAMKEERTARTRAWVREVAWMSVAADTNASKGEVIRQVDIVLTAKGKAQADAQKWLAAEKERVRADAEEFERRFTEMLNASQASDWAGTPVDPVFVCRMRGKSDDCPDSGR